MIRLILVKSTLLIFKVLKMKKIISDCTTGLVSVVEMTAEEVTDIEALKAAYAPPEPTPAPTKEQLMAQLAALSAQIQALE